MRNEPRQCGRRMQTRRPHLPQHELRRHQLCASGVSRRRRQLGHRRATTPTPLRLLLRQLALQFLVAAILT